MLFTLVRGMGFALHEMHEVSGLVMGDTSYEKYVPSTDELYLLKKDDPLVYEIYWEVLYHFHVCAQTIGWRSGRIRQMAWVSYFFYGLNDKTGLVTRF